jgi:hypothetical protein
MIDGNSRSNVLYLMEPTGRDKQGLSISLVKDDFFSFFEVWEFGWINMANIVHHITKFVLKAFFLVWREHGPFLDATYIRGP